jgi:hypothetical protein
MNVLNKPGLDQTRFRLTPPILFIRAYPGHPWLKMDSPLAKPMHRLSATPPTPDAEFRGFVFSRMDFCLQHVFA